MAAADHAAGREPRPSARDHRLVRPALDRGGVLLRCPAGHKAWKTGCRAEQRQLAEADRLGAPPGVLAIVAVRLLGLRDAARRDSGAPADVPETTIKILAAKLQQPADCFTTNRDFLRGVTRLGGLPRPQVRRRTRLADDLEGLVRPHDPR